jgi:hypothetical protein
MHGSCHCGAVRFEVSGSLQGITHCHCRTCRKIHGTVYGSSGVIAQEALRITHGAEVLTGYESSPGKKRYFCSRCGSPIYAHSQKNPGVVVLRIGALDNDPGVRPKMHIWVSEKPAWYEIVDKLPQHLQWPPS